MWLQKLPVNLVKLKKWRFLSGVPLARCPGQAHLCATFRPDRRQDQRLFEGDAEVEVLHWRPRYLRIRNV